MSVRNLPVLRVIAAVVVVLGIGIALTAFGPSESCGGEPPACVRRPAATYRLWTVIGSVFIGLVVLFIDSLLRSAKD